MTKPVLILDAYWRTVSELFSDSDLSSLREQFEVVWGKDSPIPDDVVTAALPEVVALISAAPQITQSTLDAAPNLKVVIEVSGQFPDTIDYAACRARNVQVLSCAPGFSQSTAEMALALALAGARGVVAEHELFRRGRESWKADHPQRDFSLFDADIGFIGFGAIGRETLRLLRPFRPTVRVYDPNLRAAEATAESVQIVSLADVLSNSKLVFVAALPSETNKAMIDARELSRLADGSLLVLISRAHLVDFDALLRDTAFGRIRAAIDVFPEEPVDKKSQMRDNPNLILSPHRSTAVSGGRHLIGNMILKDLNLINSGGSPCNLQSASSVKCLL
ncbi:MAG: NAD(P)-dependent oxidoreductase [Pseudoruegeria sp.]